MNLNEIAVVIGRNVRTRRLARKLSQAGLAEASQVERSQITRLEAGQVGDRGVGLAKLVRLAEALGTTVSELVRGDRRRGPRNASNDN